MTPTGYGALTAGATILALGLVCRWPPVAVLGAGLLLLVAGSLAYVLRRPRLAMTRTIERTRVEKGRPATAAVRAKNLSRRTLAATEFEQRFGDRTVRAALPPLAPEGEVERQYELPTAARGTFDLGPIEIPRSDPFGLCRTVQVQGGPQPLSVHPRLLALRPLPTGISRNLEGPSSDTSPQGSVTFHRLREYTVGDDLRNVHWPSTARLGQLVVRHNVDTAQPFTVVLLDLEPDRYRQSPDGFEEAVDVAASVSVSLAAGRAPVQLRTTMGHRVGGPGEGDPTGIVNFLTDVRTGGPGGLEAELAKLRRDRGGTALVVVTGRLDFNVLPGVAGLRRRFDRVIVLSVASGPHGIIEHTGVAVLTAATADELARRWNAGGHR